MNRKIQFSLCLALPFLLGAAHFYSPLQAADATLSVDVSRPGARVSPTLYGAFFEEINRAGDGGIYAEMVQNRSFEDASVPLGWSFMAPNGAATWNLDRSTPLNGRNMTSLRLDIGKSGARVGIVSQGFKGVASGKWTTRNRKPPTFPGSTRRPANRATASRFRVENASIFRFMHARAMVFAGR